MKFKVIDTILYYDIPLIVEMVGQDEKMYIAFATDVDSDDDGNIVYYVIESNFKERNDFMREKIGLKEIIEKRNREVFKIEGLAFEGVEFECLNKEVILEKYIPE